MWIRILIDEIIYRTIDFPIYTLGALFLSLICGINCLSRILGLDSKEIGALYTWLLYSVYLHLRLSRGWWRKRSAWLALIGFLIGVNLMIYALHSYLST
ncbi:cytochrome c biogenesis protein CcsA [Paenibacillus lactis]|uniref:cytochrome c biogenesis protein CcsA n=1 Tax=Paenibacillus lactis TaxID=228574 RepID=UPI000A05E764